MGWLSKKRSNILEAYRVRLHVSNISDLAFFQARVYQNRSTTLTMPTDVLSEDTSFPDSPKQTVQTAIHPLRVHTEPVRFSVTAYSPALFAPETTKCQDIAVTCFPCVIHRFSFQKVRREPRKLFPPTGPRKHIDIGPITPPPPPPTPKGTLEDRLRWILTPPIHELLSDPQLTLPQKPFPFQTMGIKWLYDRDSALLADEMGLGKTMQAIIAARLLWRAGTINLILVVCPKTLIPTWQNEFAKWWPPVTENVKVIGPDRLFDLRLATPNITVKIINYESLAREDPGELKKDTYGHDLFIIDEAQKIKSPGSKTAQAVKAMKAPRRWALTGTPLENRIEDLISIFDFVRPGLLRQDQSQQIVKDRIRPYMLRRLTNEVMLELPDKIEQDFELELDPEHRETYDRLERDGVVELNAKGDSITVTHVFALINKLRQVCNFDPATGASAKLERLLEDLEDVAGSHRKALVFSQFVEQPFGLKRLGAELEKRQIADRQETTWQFLQLHGQIPPTKREGIIKQFLSDPDALALLLNYTVGGLGLNLQAANYVFLFDRWWNPAVEDQAVKRAHRIGQTEKVFVRRFYCKDTIEERILRKLAEKRRLFRNIIDEGRPEPDSLGLSEEEIFQLFNLKVRPGKKSQSTVPPLVVLDNMDPQQFEVMVAQLYEKQGYIVEHRGGSHDEGIDILAERISAGARERVVIQCKHQQTNVGRPILQQLWGIVSNDPSFTRGDLVSTSGFTSEAKQFAQGKRLTLIDRPLLTDLVHKSDIAHFENPST